MHLGDNSSKGWIALKEIFSQKKMTAKRVQLGRKIIDSSANFKAVGEISNEFVVRRKRLQDNSDLCMVFKLLWRVLSGFSDNPLVLSEDGYMQLDIYLQKALLGNQFSDTESVKLADADHRYDIARFGSLLENSFCDILIELIEMWTGTSYGRLQAAFSWSLLYSMVDVDAFPPKFRPIYEVNLISKIPENEFFNKFSSDRISRKRVHSYLEWCDRHDLSLETQARLLCRRQGITLTTSKKDLVSLQHRIDSPNKEAQEKNNPRLHYVYEGGDEASGSDEDGSEGPFEDDDFTNIGRKSKWTKLHNALKVIQNVERQKALEEEEEEARRLAALSPVKKVTCKSGDKAKTGSQRRSLFDMSGGNRSHGLRKRGFLSSGSELNAITTLLLEGTDVNDTLYHIVSKNHKSTTRPMSPRRPESAKSVMKIDDEGIKASRYVMSFDGIGSRDYEDLMSHFPATPIKWKQSRDRLYHHNSEANFSKISRFERVNSLPKRSGLKEVVQASSTNLLEHPQQHRPMSPKFRRPHYNQHFVSGSKAVSADCPDDESTASSAMMVDLLHALYESLPITKPAQNQTIERSHLVVRK